MTRKQRRIIRECREATGEHFLVVEQFLVATPKRRKELLTALQDVCDGLSITESKLYDVLHPEK